MPALPDVQKVSGENAMMTVNGLDILVDGDTELNIEREVFEWKIRGVPITQHIESKRVTVTGSISGVPTGAAADVLSTYMGADRLDGTVTFDNVNLPNVSITYTFTDDSDKITLGDVKIKSLKISAKDGEVIRIEADFAANTISKG